LIKHNFNIFLIKKIFFKKLYTIISNIQLQYTLICFKHFLTSTGFAIVSKIKEIFNHETLLEKKRNKKKINSMPFVFMLCVLNSESLIKLIYTSNKKILIILFLIMQFIYFLDKINCVVLRYINPSNCIIF
jgi:hypothetical protein